MSGAAARLWDVLEPYVAAEGVELDDLEVAGSGRGRILRVTVDAPDGLGVDRIADLSLGMSRLLDDLDPFEGSYTLEVSSPGLERKLRRPAHYHKSVGREVKVKTDEPIEGARSHRGTLGEVGDEGFVVAVDGEPRRIRFDQVTSATTVFTWGPAERAGKRR